ncbi:hypothetical protein H104_02253 [Trichophyton rubrum CBS 289.86]|nr:hypothetical protein H104_02253 [Trichophyton rubrum CBS 289.86]
MFFLPLVLLRCVLSCVALSFFLSFFFFFNPSSPSPPFFDLLWFGHIMYRPCSPFRFDSFSLLSLYSHFHVPQSQSQSLAQLIYYVMSSYPFLSTFSFFFIFISRFPHPILLLMSLIITWSLLLTQTGAYGIFFYFPFFFSILNSLFFLFLSFSNPRMRSMELTC